MKTTSLQETKNYAIKLANELSEGDILCLYGELGAGKTALTKGLAEGLGIHEEITSPTFTLMNIYDVKSNKNGIKQLIHFDTYRLKDEQEMIGIGAEDYLGTPGTVCVVEWPEKIEGLLFEKKLKKITIKHLGGNEREIIVD